MLPHYTSPTLALLLTLSLLTEGLTQNLLREEGPKKTIPPEALLKAETLVSTLNYTALFRAMLNHWPFDPFSHAAKNLGIENLSDEKRHHIEKWMQEFTQKRLESIDLKKFEKAVITAMAETFTVEEMQALLDFYKTEAGASYLKKQPEFTRRLAAIQEELLAESLRSLINSAAENLDTLKKLILQGPDNPTSETPPPSHR